MATTNPVDISSLDPATIAMHLGNPTGPVGVAVIERLTKSNEVTYTSALQRLAPYPDDRILEIGFGNGREVSRILGLADRLSYAGIDISPTMVAEAGRNNETFIAAAQASFAEGSSSRLNMPDASFDRALALNTIYFWQEPGQDLREIRRVLRPGGKLVLGAVAPRSTVGRAIFDQGFKLYEQDQIEALLRAAGFDDVRIDTVTETVMMANGEWTRDYHLACAI